MKRNTSPKKLPENGRVAVEGGSYSLMITAIVLALLIAVNILAASLPTSLTQYDMSAAKLYSITSNTKVVVNALEEDVTIYWIVQADQEDAVIENLLGRYEALSDHIHVEKINPDVYPTFAEQYTDETVENNSLVVECGERSRYIGYDDIYLYEADLYSYSYNTSFDGEGAVTSAIDYVVNEEQPIVYTLEGHGEAELPSAFREQLQRDNISLSAFSLLTADEIPADAACILIYSPSTDISEAEKEMLASYVSGGGKLLVMAGPSTDSDLSILYSLLEDYGVTASEGIVIEGDRAHYAFGQPYILMPDMAEDEMTDSLIAENYYPILPISQGLTVGESPSGAAVTELLTTSDSAFSKIAGYELSTYEKEEGDTDGPFALSVSVTSSGGGQLVWFSSSHFLDDLYNAYSSGANVNLVMNALSSLIGESEAMAIRSKSLNYNYLTISDSVSSLLKVTMVGIFPLLYLGAGIYVVVRRRRLQNEAK